MQGSRLPAPRHLLLIVSHPESRPGLRVLQGPGVGRRAFRPLATRIFAASAETDPDGPDGSEKGIVLKAIVSWLSIWGWTIMAVASALASGLIKFGAADKASGPSLVLFVYPSAISAAASGPHFPAVLLLCRRLGRS